MTDTEGEPPDGEAAPGSPVAEGEGFGDGEKTTEEKALDLGTAAFDKRKYGFPPLNTDRRNDVN